MTVRLSAADISAACSRRWLSCAALLLRRRPDFAERFPEPEGYVYIRRDGESPRFFKLSSNSCQSCALLRAPSVKPSNSFLPSGMTPISTRMHSSRPPAGLTDRGRWPTRERSAGSTGRAFSNGYARRSRPASGARLMAPTAPARSLPSAQAPRRGRPSRCSASTGSASGNDRTRALTTPRPIKPTSAHRPIRLAAQPRQTPDLSTRKICSDNRDQLC